jgi:hypothetical protein
MFNDTDTSSTEQRHSDGPEQFNHPQLYYGYGSKPVKTLLYSPKQLGILRMFIPPNHPIDGYIYPLVMTNIAMV